MWLGFGLMYKLLGGPLTLRSFLISAAVVTSGSFCRRTALDQQGSEHFSAGVEGHSSSKEKSTVTSASKMQAYMASDRMSGILQGQKGAVKDW